MSVPSATAMDPQCEICLPDMADEIRDGVAFDHLAGDSNAYYLNLYLGRPGYHGHVRLVLHQPGSY